MITLHDRRMRCGMRAKLYCLLLSTVPLLFVSEIALAHGNHQTDFSGYEIFLGI